MNDTIDVIGFEKLDENFGRAGAILRKLAGQHKLSHAATDELLAAFIIHMTGDLVAAVVETGVAEGGNVTTRCNNVTSILHRIVNVSRANHFEAPEMVQ